MPFLKNLDLLLTENCLQILLNQKANSKLARLKKWVLEGQGNPVNKN